MLNKEELFERVEDFQRWANQRVNTDFWQALFGFLCQMIYHGGACIEYNGKVYWVKTTMDAIKLLLDIYRDEICKKEGGGASKSL